MDIFLVDNYLYMYRYRAIPVSNSSRKVVSGRGVARKLGDGGCLELGEV